MIDIEYLEEQVLEQIKKGYTQPDDVTALDIVDGVIIPYVKDVIRANDMMQNPDNY